MNNRFGRYDGSRRSERYIPSRRSQARRQRGRDMDERGMHSSVDAYNDMRRSYPESEPQRRARDDRYDDRYYDREDARGRSPREERYDSSYRRRDERYDDRDFPGERGAYARDRAERSDRRYKEDYYERGEGGRETSRDYYDDRGYAGEPYYPDMYQAGAQYPAWGVPPVYGAPVPPYYAPFPEAYDAYSYDMLYGSPMYDDEYQSADQLSEEERYGGYMDPLPNSGGREGVSQEADAEPENPAERQKDPDELFEEPDNSDYIEKRRASDVLFGDPYSGLPDADDARQTMSELGRSAEGAEEDEEPFDVLDDDFDDEEEIENVPPAASPEPVKPPREERADAASRRGEFVFPDEHEERPKRERRFGSEPATRGNAAFDESHRKENDHTSARTMTRERQDAELTTPKTKLIAVAAAMLCLLGAVFVSSGHIINDGSIMKEQRSAAFDINMGSESLTGNVINGVRGLPKVYTLPMSESPANKPREDGFSTFIDDDGDRHDTYNDETISVDCSRKRYKAGEYSVIAAVAHVKISHPTQLRSAFAGGEYSSKREKLSVVGRSYNAIVGINGEMYNYSGKSSTLIRNGTTYRTNAIIGYTLYIDSNGDFFIKYSPKAESEGFLTENKIFQTIQFGPPLVIDGEAIRFKYDATAITARNPRSALGQVGPLEYVLVAVEGRSSESKGLGADEMGQLMLSLGCTQAYNVDGGQSSVLVFNGKPYNKVANGGERQFSDLIYFGTAMPEK